MGRQTRGEEKRQEAGPLAEPGRGGCLAGSTGTVVERPRRRGGPASEGSDSRQLPTGAPRPSPWPLSLVPQLTSLPEVGGSLDTESLSSEGFSTPLPQNFLQRCRRKSE